MRAKPIQLSVLFGPLLQVLGWQQPTCQTSCPIWPLTFCGTPRAGPSTPLRWLPLPGVRTWGETFPPHPATTTTCWQLTLSTTTTSSKSCWKPCVTSANRGAERRCCGPTRSGSSQTWGSRSALRAFSTQRCSPSSQSRRWAYTRPRQRSKRTLQRGVSGSAVKLHVPLADLVPCREKSGCDLC